MLIPQHGAAHYDVIMFVSHIPTGYENARAAVANYVSTPDTPVTSRVSFLQ